MFEATLRLGQIFLPKNSAYKHKQGFLAAKLGQTFGQKFDGKRPSTSKLEQVFQQKFDSTGAKVFRKFLQSQVKIKHPNWGNF
jgi:hypothetical protein